MWNVSLADYVWGDKKDSFTGFYGQASTSATSLLADSAGKTRIPTQADVDAASKPEDKLTLLKQMADVVNVQAEAGIATGRADSIASLTQSAKDMLASLSTVVDGLKDSDGNIPTDYQSGVTSALTSLRTAMDNISTLTSRADSTVASQVVSDLATMDNQAGTLATDAGSTWRRSGTTFRADPTKLLDILV